MMFRDVGTVLNERIHLTMVIRSVPDSLSLILGWTKWPGLAALHWAKQVNLFCLCTFPQILVPLAAAQFTDNLNAKGRSGSTPLPLRTHCRARENIVLMMIVQAMGSCWHLNMIFKLMHVIAGSSCCFHNWCYYHSFTIESFGWLDCKNIVHMIIIVLNNAYYLFKNKIENLLLLARSILSICLLASAQGSEMELYALRQEVSQAYAFWQVLWART